MPPGVKSSGEITWGHWPVSDGAQHYETQAFKAPVAQPYIKITAMYQTSGQLHYTHELAVPPLTANGAFVQSRRALATYRFVIPGGDQGVDASALREHLSGYARSFVDLITHENIKNGGINNQGMGLDQPLFAVDMVSYVGQSIAMVLADERAGGDSDRGATCRRTASRMRSWTRHPGPAPWSEPVLGLFDAIEKGSIFPDAPTAAPYVSHIWRITRPGSQFDWATDEGSARPDDRAPQGGGRQRALPDRRVLASQRRPGAFLHGAAGVRRHPHRRGPDQHAAVDAEPDGDAPDDRDGARPAVSPGRGRSRAGGRRVRRQDGAGALRHRARRPSRPRPPSAPCASPSRATRTRR